MVDDISEDVLLGSDLGRSTLANWLLEADNSTKSVKVTRAQKKLKVEQDKIDSNNITASGASPHLLAEAFDFSDDFFSQEPVHATPPSSDSSELPLPELTVDHSDKNILIAQQSEDPSLKTIRELATRQERGYAYQDGVLTHTDLLYGTNPVRQVVLPLERRKVALTIAHDSDLGGHCGVKRTLKRLHSCVIWPNINRDVTNHVRQCGPCQKYSKYHKSKAPLHPLPIVGMPFQRIAFDLVGPYPRTKRNHKYLLTSICYFSRYPEAIPLMNAQWLQQWLRYFPGPVYHQRYLLIRVQCS